MQSELVTHKIFSLSEINNHCPKDCYEYMDFEETDDEHTPLAFVVRESVKCTKGKFVSIDLNNEEDELFEWQRHVNEDYSVWDNAEDMKKHIKHLLTIETTDQTIDQTIHHLLDIHIR